MKRVIRDCKNGVAIEKVGGMNMASIEDILARWAKAPSETEEGKCDNAISAITDAIRQAQCLSDKDVRIIKQGSYQNRTNVKKDSDVDIIVCLFDSFFHDGLSSDDEKVMGLTDSKYSFGQFKNDVQQILIPKFGSSAVERKNKCIVVKGNDYRIDADVIPCLEHRRYSSRDRYITGVESRSDQNERIINWPEQHYNNGVAKNDSTNRAFKSAVRILKNAKNDMVDNGSLTDDSISSFLIECLVWNVPNDAFNRTTWTSLTRSVLATLFNATLKQEDCAEYAEVSDLKWLFKGQTKWTYQTAHAFLDKAWRYLGYD